MLLGFEGGLDLLESFKADEIHCRGQEFGVLLGELVAE